MNRPTFFVSSTIYDFRDLRSALKYYLEQQGCKVLASEFNDFEKPLDQHSYNACLQSIHAADYFILLIGTRVGGWYDATKRVSITQREYREAYELQQGGKIKLINFVRSEVWHVKEDRNELLKFLESTALDASVKSQIANHPTKMAADADFLIAFLNEVGRNRETKLATQGIVEPPTGNWIHTFSTFRDVIDVIQGHVFSSLPVEDLIVRRLLRSELRKFVGECLVRFKGKVYSPRSAIERFHEENPLTVANKQEEFTPVNAASWDHLSFFAMHLLSWRLNPIVLPEVLTRSTFLTFDLRSNTYRETPVYEALYRLQEEIRRINSAVDRNPLTIVFQHSRARRIAVGDTIDIETVPLAALLHALDRWVNILELSSGIASHLEGLPFSMPRLRHDSPVQGMQREIDDERPTDDEISSFIANS